MEGNSIESTPEIYLIAFNVNGYTCLRKEAQNVLLGVIGNEAIYEFDDVMQLDFFMQRFNNKRRDN